MLFEMTCQVVQGGLSFHFRPADVGLRAEVAVRAAVHVPAPARHRPAQHAQVPHHQGVQVPRRLRVPHRAAGAFLLLKKGEKKVPTE